MNFEDRLKEIDDYLENMTLEEVIKDLEEYGFIIEDVKNKEEAGIFLLNELFEEVK